MNIILNLTDKQYELIGRVVSCWGYIDFLISEVLRGMTTLNKEDSFTMIHSADVRTKLEWIKQVMSNKLPDEDQAAMKKVCSEIARLSSERNLLSHMVVLWDKTLTEPTAILFKRAGAKPQKITDEFLEQTLRQMTECSSDLLDICIKFGYVQTESKGQ